MSTSGALRAFGSSSAATLPVLRGSWRSAPLQFPRASADSGAKRSVADARLDNHTNNVSLIGGITPLQARYKLRSVLWDESTLKRTRKCGRYRITRAYDVGVALNGTRAHYTNIQLCGSVHACPVCAPKIRQRRAGEIDRAVHAYLAAGGLALFQTFTLPHDFGDELAPLLKNVANAFRKVIGGSGYLTDKRDYSITGTIRASETTFGKAGAHPHLHVIFFCDRQLSDAEVLTLNARLFARWAAAIEGVGYRAPLIGLCPIERVTTSGLGAYVQKYVMTAETERRLGMEMTRHDLKAARRKGRTPFQVLRDFADTGDCADLELWRDWERASHGTQSLTWSKGLKARFAVNEKTDDELAAEKVGGEIIAVLTIEQWNDVNAESAHCALLEIAERDGADGVALWLSFAAMRRSNREAHFRAQRAALDR